MIVIIGCAIALAVFVFVMFMLLTQRMSEKYAVLWLIVLIALVVVVLVPGAMDTLTRITGVQLPSNLFFAGAILLLIGVSLHLSWELSTSEAEARRLAEEAAITRAEIADLSTRLARLETSADEAPE